MKKESNANALDSFFHITLLIRVSGFSWLVIFLLSV